MMNAVMHRLPVSLNPEVDPLSGMAVSFMVMAFFSATEHLCYSNIIAFKRQ